MLKRLLWIASLTIAAAAVSFAGQSDDYSALNVTATQDLDACQESALAQYNNCISGCGNDVWCDVWCAVELNSAIAACQGG